MSPAEESDEGIAAVLSRLDDMAILSAGWLDGGGEKVTGEALERAREMLPELLRRDIPRPRIYPTPEGGLQAEWSGEGREVSITFEVDGALSALAVSGDSGEPDELHDGDAERIARFVLRVR
ncbi:MAG TPA: hypothetical protein VMV07_16945 [Streptosporangiaceae bacterium]|nr:hypothetical protein [Streptosporangiaceae bacterium]